MRLNVTYASNVPGADKVWYHAKPNKAYSSPETEARELERLARRIELVGREILKGDLHIVSTKSTKGVIGICVTTGISSGPKRFDFRSFIGWIEIFDMETGLATRAAMPPIR